MRAPAALALALLLASAGPVAAQSDPPADAPTDGPAEGTDGTRDADTPTEEATNETTNETTAETPAVPAADRSPTRASRARSRAASVRAAPEMTDEERLDRAAVLRRAGADAQAAALLELARDRSPRLSAELGLACQGAGRPADAERHLTEALASEGDPWIEEHREALDLARRFARQAIGVVIVSCRTRGAEVWVSGAADRPVACSAPVSAPVGDQHVEVRAPGFRSVRRLAEVRRDRDVVVRVQLEPYECHTPGMQHIGGADGTCCWPGQEAIEGRCVGVRECPNGGRLVGDECIGGHAPPPPAPDRLADFRFGLYGGVTNFGRTDTSLFRPDVDANGALGSLGPRVELRVGLRVFSLFALELTLGGTRQTLSTWLDCAPGAPSCIPRAPVAYTIDGGLMFSAHTDPPRLGGNVDFHLGVGARPFARVFFDDDGDGAELTATVVPAELGMSVFLAEAASLDLIGQAELWIPWEYCGHGAGGASYCVDSSQLEYELAWSALAGVTFHAD